VQFDDIEDDLRDFGIIEGWAAAQTIRREQQLQHRPRNRKASVCTLSRIKSSPPARRIFTNAVRRQFQLARQEP